MAPPRSARATSAQGTRPVLLHFQVDSKIRLDNLEQQLKTLGDEVRTVQKRLDTTPAAAPPVLGLDRALDDIRAKLASIEQALLRMTATTSSRTAMYPSTNGVSGRVLLENFYPEEMLFVVNGTQTRVAPNQTISVDAVPAGALTYEVVSPTWGSRARKTTTLAANETFRITAR